MKNLYLYMFIYLYIAAGGLELRLGLRQKKHAARSFCFIQSQDTLHHSGLDMTDQRRIHFINSVSSKSTSNTFQVTSMFCLDIGGATSISHEGDVKS